MDFSQVFHIFRILLEVVYPFPALKLDYTIDNDLFSESRSKVTLESEF